MKEKSKRYIYMRMLKYTRKNSTLGTDISDVPGFISVVVDRHNSNQSVGVVMLWQGEL